MAAEKVQLGYNAKLYINTTNTYVDPASIAVSNTVVAMTNVRDLTLSLEKSVVDVTVRGNNGWKAEVGALKSASVEFGMIADPEDVYYNAVRDAWLNSTPTQFAVFSGLLTSPVGTDTEGLVAVFDINSFSRDEPLDGAQTVAVKMTPTYITNSTYAPAWKEVASS